MSTNPQRLADLKAYSELRQRDWLDFVRRVKRRHRTFPDETVHELGRVFNVTAWKVSKALDEPEG